MELLMETPTNLHLTQLPPLHIQVLYYFPVLPRQCQHWINLKNKIHKIGIYFRSNVFTNIRQLEASFFHYITTICKGKNRDTDA